MEHSLLNLNSQADAIQDLQSTTDFVEQINLGERVDETKKGYQSEKEGYYPQSQIRLLKVGNIQNQVKIQKIKTTKQGSQKPINPLSSLTNTKNFKEDQFFEELNQDDDRFQNQQTLEFLNLKKCANIISQTLGEQVSLQFNVIFNQFKRQNIHEMNCLEQLWEEYRQQNLHQDVFKAAYLLINITTFQNNSKLYGQIKNLCLDLRKIHSTKSKKFKTFIKDISYEYQINQINNQQ
ncbi:hypothetical protein ABPG72_004134 [Tetrahymena utriculariae]